MKDEENEFKEQLN